MEWLIESLFWMGLALLTWFFYGPHRRYWIDLTRHRLFVARDMLFLSAAEERISFDSEAYRAIRGTLNGMIRFVDDLSIWHLLLMSRNRQMHELGREHHRRQLLMLRELPVGSREAAKTAIQNSQVALIEYMCATSLVFFVAMWIWRLVHWLGQSRTRLHRRWRRIGWLAAAQGDFEDFSRDKLREYMTSA